MASEKQPQNTFASDVATAFIVGVGALFVVNYLKSGGSLGGISLPTEGSTPAAGGDNPIQQIIQQISPTGSGCAKYDSTHIATIAEAGYHLRGQPTVSCEEFVTSLKIHNSPAAGAGEQIYDLIMRKGYNPGALEGIFWAESHYGTDVVHGVQYAAATDNWCNMHSAWNDQYPTSTINGDANFSTHGGWVEGVNQCLQMMDYIIDHRAHSDLISNVAYITTPTVENNTARYINNIEGKMNDLNAATFAK